MRRKNKAVKYGWNRKKMKKKHAKKRIERPQRRKVNLKSEKSVLARGAAAAKLNKKGAHKKWKTGTSQREETLSLFHLILFISRASAVVVVAVVASFFFFSFIHLFFCDSFCFFSGVGSLFAFTLCVGVFMCDLIKLVLVLVLSLCT